MLQKTFNVPVRLAQIHSNIDFGALSSVPFKIGSEKETLKRLRGVLDFKGEVIRFESYGMTEVRQ